MTHVGDILSTVLDVQYSGGDVMSTMGGGGLS